MLLVLVTLAVGALVIGINRAQLNRFRSQLHSRAMACVDQGDRRNAIKSLRAYVHYAPQDLDSLVLLGELLGERSATTQEKANSLAVFREVLKQNPAFAMARRRAADLAVELGRAGEALEEIRTLWQQGRPDPHLAELLGRSLEIAERPLEAILAYEAAITEDPRRIGCFVRVAQLYRNSLGRPDLADRSIDRLIRNNPDAVEANRAYLMYLSQHGSLPALRSSATRALDPSLHDTQFLVTLSGLFADQGDYKNALEYLRVAIEQSPHEFLPRWKLAWLRYDSGDIELANEVIEDALKFHPNDMNLSWMRVMLAAEAGNTQLADELLEPLQHGASAPSISCIRARASMKSGDWIRASRTLERATSSLPLGSQLSQHARYLLTRCYREIGDADRQLHAARRMVQSEKWNQRSRAELAEALLASGRLDDAVAEYCLLANRDQAGVAVRLRAAELAVVRNLLLPKTARDWHTAATLIRDMLRDDPENLAAALLHAEVLCGKGLFSKATQFLDQACQSQGRTLDLMIAQVGLLELQGKWKEANELLLRATTDHGISLKMLLAHWRHWGLRGGIRREVVDQLSSWANQLRPLPEPQALALAAARCRVTDILDPVYLEKPEKTDHLDTWVAVLETSLAMGAKRDARAALDRIRLIEGDGGGYCAYGEASILLAGTIARETFKKSDELLAAAIRSRPSWSRPYLKRAELCQLSGKADAAIKHYLSAIQLGCRDWFILRRTFGLLVSRGRFHEALLLLPSSRRDAIGIDSYQVQLSIRNWRQDYHRGRLRQLKQTALEPRRWDRFSRGSPFTLKPDNSKWDDESDFFLFFASLIQTGNLDGARRQLEQLPAPLKTNNLLLAVCLEQLGDVGAAIEQYKLAIDAHPDDTSVLGAIASFCIRRPNVGRMRDAVRLIGELSRRFRRDEKAALDWAQRARTIVVCATSGFAGFQRALVTLQTRLQISNDPADLRALAIVLSGRGFRATDAQAIHAFERLDVVQPLQTQDRLVLARLYARSGEHQKARECVRRLGELSRIEPALLSLFLKRLTGRQPDPAELDSWSEEVNKLPASFQKVELKARLLLCRGDVDGVSELLASCVHNSRTQVGKETTMGMTAGLLEALANTAQRNQDTNAAERLMKESERWFRNFAATQPMARITLIDHLRRRKKTEEAFDRCEELWDLDPRSAAWMSLKILRSATRSEKREYRIEQGLRKAFGEAPGDSKLALMLANLRELQGEYSEAATLLTEVAESEPGNWLALNNLAYIKARRGHGRSGLKHVEQAMDLVGPKPELLDTQAICYLAAGDKDRGISALWEAVMETENPRYFFHLAEAYDQSGNRLAAELAFRRALALGLDVTDAHPLDRSSYRALQQHFAAP